MSVAISSAIFVRADDIYDDDANETTWNDFARNIVYQIKLLNPAAGDTFSSRIIVF